jgi:4-hydroxybenzoate polyprenyltransferase
VRGPERHPDGVSDAGLCAPMAMTDTAGMSAPQAPATPGASSERRGSGRRGPAPVRLVRAAHPRLALITAAAMAVAAAVSGRPGREVGLVFVTVLVGQAILGWDNDLVDEHDDRAADRPGKPLATGSLDRGTVWFALACGVLLVVPLSLSSGFEAGAAYLLSLLVGVLGNRWLRYGLLSWLPWAVAYALYPAYLSYGGWGGGRHGSPPTVAMTVAAALLGVGVHVLTSLPGLVADNDAGHRHLPLRLGLRLGAPRLLVLSIAWCGLAVALILVVGMAVGLSQ